jgi:hypothetical protein
MPAASLHAAGTITTYTTRPTFGGEAVVDWSGLGSGGIIGSSFNNLLSSSPGVSVSGSTVDLLGVFTQGFDYLGNFASGDRLLQTTQVVARGQIPRAPGPIRLTFNAPVFGAGLQISTNIIGPFTATLKAFDVNGVLLSTMSAPGTSTFQTVGDNSAPFLGIRSTLAEVAAVEVDVPGLTGITVNRMQVALGPPGITSFTTSAIGKITAYSSVQSFGGDFTVDWGALGIPGTLVGSVFNNFPSNVAGVTVSGSTPDLVERLDQGIDYAGNFAQFDRLLQTSAVVARGQIPKAPGPIRFTFNGPVFGAGTQISTNILGPFTATLKAFNSSGALIATTSASGTSTSQLVGDNSAPFLGIRSSAQEIAAVEVDVPGLTGVTVNRLLGALNGSLITINSFFVSQLYRDLLGIAPDPIGVTNWVTQLNSGLVTRAQVADAFFVDPRFQTNALFIAQCYLGVLQRDPDFAGWEGILNLMTGGASQATTLAGFLNTPDSQAIWGSMSCVNGAAGCSTDAAYVTLLYQNLLGRAPDPAGAAYWNFLLDLGFLSRSNAMMGFMQSPEFAAHVRNRANANLLYLGFLRRTGEPTGLNYWTVVMNFGVPLVNVVQGFITSPEYFARF